MDSTAGLDVHAAEGGKILMMLDEQIAQAALDRWTASVADWVASIGPNSGLQAKWFSIHAIAFGDTGLALIRRQVRERLQWLERLPSDLQYLRRMQYLTNRTDTSGPAVLGVAKTMPAYISTGRILELRAATNTKFSTEKLVRFCEELNICMASKCYLAASMLLRSITNHVPPVFKCKSFDEVIAQTTGRSFHAQLSRLGTQARNVAERFLHEQIGAAEATPHEPQVDFRSELDALLGEVVVLLRTK